MECPYDSDTVDHNHDTAGNLSGCMAGDNRNNTALVHRSRGILHQHDLYDRLYEADDQF